MSSRLRRAVVLSFDALLLATAAFFVARAAVPAAGVANADIVSVDSGLWEEMSAGRNQVGDSSASQTFVVFTDFQCPFCASAARTLDSLSQDRNVFPRVVVRHFPLSFHASASRAAWAFECARSLGAQRALYDSLYARQADLDSLKLNDLARMAQVTDVSAFISCANADSTHRAVDHDVSLGARAGVTGTPAIFIDGDRIPPAAPTQLRILLRDRLATARR